MITYNLSDAIIGDTYDAGVAFQIVINDIPLDLTTGIVKMFIYKYGQSAIEFTPENNKLEIDANDTSKLRITIQDIDFPIGNYNYKIKITVNNIKKTYIKGNWNIIDG